MSSSFHLERGDTKQPSFIQAKIDRCAQFLGRFGIEGVTASFEPGQLNRIREASYPAHAQEILEEYTVLVGLSDPNSTLLACLQPTDDEYTLLVDANTLPKLSDDDQSAFDVLYSSAAKTQRALDFPQAQLTNTLGSNVASIPKLYDQVEEVLKLLSPTGEQPALATPVMQCMRLDLQPTKLFLLGEVRKRALDIHEEATVNTIVQDVIRVQRALSWPRQSLN